MQLDALLRRFFPVIVGGLLALAAYFQAAGLSSVLEVTVLENTAAGGVAPLRPAPATLEGREHVATADPILARNPFDSITGPLDGTAKPLDAAPPTFAGAQDDVPCDRGQVVLIMASDDPQWSFVAVVIGGQRLLRRRGDDVDGRAVEHIGWDRVWLLRDGVRCELRLGAPDRSAKPSAPHSPAVPQAKKKASRSKVPPDIASKIQKVSEREFIVDRSALDRILENQADFMKSVRLVPEKKDGAVVGLRVSRVAPDSLLGMLGLKNGDRIRSINGFSLTDPQKALEAYARLRTADRLSLAIQRGGKDANIDFQIK